MCSRHRRWTTGSPGTRNQGGGVFAFEANFDAQADAAWDVHAADLDGDGDLDVAGRRRKHIRLVRERGCAHGRRPRGVEVTIRPGHITVSWEPLGLTESGGAPESLRYVVTATPVPDGAGVSCTVAAPDSECTIEVQTRGSHTRCRCSRRMTPAWGRGWEANTPAEVPWGFSDARGSRRLGTRRQRGVRGGPGRRRRRRRAHSPPILTTRSDGSTTWGGDTFFGETDDRDGSWTAPKPSTQRTWTGTGDLDVLSASSNDDTIAWHENMGGGTFQSHTIATDAILARDVHAVDLNGDGLHRRAVGLQSTTTASPGTQTCATEHSPRRSDIAVDAYGAQAVHAADVDGDGDLDVLSASALDDTVAWYANLGSLAFSARRGDRPGRRRGRRLACGGPDRGTAPVDVLSGLIMG